MRMLLLCAHPRVANYGPVALRSVGERAHAVFSNVAGSTPTNWPWSALSARISAMELARVECGVVRPEFLNRPCRGVV